MCLDIHTRYYCALGIIGIALKYSRKNNIKKHFVLISQTSRFCFLMLKGLVCRIKGDLLGEMEYNIHRYVLRFQNYVFICGISPENWSCHVFVTSWALFIHRGVVHHRVHHVALKSFDLQSPWMLKPNRSSTEGPLCLLRLFAKPVLIRKWSRMQVAYHKPYLQLL